MANVQQIAAVTHILANVLHKLEGQDLWQYDEGWDDRRVGTNTGVTAAQVRGIRTQLRMKLEPRERAFERLVRLHNALCSRTNNMDLVFTFQSKEDHNDLG